MDTQDNAGELTPLEQRIFDFDVFGRKLADDIERLADTQPQTLTRLVEAISKGDKSLSNQVLLRWGIRR